MKEYQYNKSYMKKYISCSFHSPYFIYKNRRVVQQVKELGHTGFVDVGCNVNPVIKEEGSLRYQAEKAKLNYFGYDIVPEYFSPEIVQFLDPSCSTYKQVNGKIGDIVNLPCSSNSIPCITCIDTLEHISHLSESYKQLYRVLSLDGSVIIVIPDLYKLDSLDLEHIRRKRKSSHIHKTNLSTWIGEAENAGFTVKKDSLSPLGVLSGLSYMAWLIDDYVPTRSKESDDDTFSEKGMLHRKAKSLLVEYDYLGDHVISKESRLEALSLLLRCDWFRFWTWFEQRTQEIIKSNTGKKSF